MSDKVTVESIVEEIDNLDDEGKRRWFAKWLKDPKIRKKFRDALLGLDRENDEAR